VGTPVWWRGLVAVVSAILIFEAGAVAPGPRVSAASHREDAPSTLNAAPNEPPRGLDSPDTSNTICDDFERPDNPTDLGSGPLGLWENPGTAFNGGVSLVNGEARFVLASTYHSQRGVDGIWAQAPFEIRLKHRLLSPDGRPFVTRAGLSESGFLEGTIPAQDFYRLRTNLQANPVGLWQYPEAFEDNQSIGGGTVLFDADYVPGTMIYSRFRVLPPDGMYVKSWYATEQEPALWTSVPLSDPTPTSMRWLALQLQGQLDIPENPPDWRIDEVCLDRDPPPVLLAEDAPEETEWNHNPNTETGGDPVNTFNGSFSIRGDDAVMPGRGPLIDFSRTYNSNDPRVGPMGPGWTHNYATRLALANDASGDVYLFGPEGRSDRYAHNPDGSFTPPPAIHTRLVANPDGTFTATRPDQTTWTFDAGGRLTAIKDRYGNTSTLTYSGGRLASISDPAGRGNLSLAYTNGLLTSITDWASPARTVTYQYDANGRLWKVTDREGRTTTFGYDGSSPRLTTITDARGHTALTLTYDAQNRVATQKDARGLTTGETTTFDYVVNGDGTRVTTITSPPTSFEPTFAPTVVDAYAANGWLGQRVEHPSSTEALTTSYTYDTTGNRNSVTDPRGKTTDFCYDVSYAGAPLTGAWGSVTRVIAPAPITGANRPVLLTAYDAKNNPTQVVTPKGVPSGSTVTCSTDLSAIDASYATDYAYDPTQTALLSVTTHYTDPDLGALTATTKYEYGDTANPGHVTRMIPPRGNTGPSPDYTYATTYAYFGSGSKAGMLSSVIDPLANTTTYDYDAVGHRISSVDALGNAAGGVPADHRTDYVYDKQDRLRFVKLPAPVAGGTQLVTETRYDEVGNLTVRIDANGQVVTYAYDERDALAQVKECPCTWTDPATPPSGVITTEYAYDAGGNITRVTRAKNDGTYERATDYLYDGRNLARRETQYPAWPSTSGLLVASMTYDPSGNLENRVDQLAQTTTFGYDALNRLTSVAYDDPGTPDVGYAYDANGNRTQMTDGTGTTTYAYDQLVRLTSVTSPGPTTVGYRYDRDGNRTKLIYPDATPVTYTFDKAGRLGSLSDWASRSVAYTYWADGLVKTATNPDNSVATYSYDNARRLVEILHTAAGGPVLDRFYYTLDPVGNVATLANGSLAPQFGRPDGFVSSNGTWTGSYVSINEVPPNDATFLASPTGPTTSNYYEVSLSDVTPPGTLTGITVRYRYAKSGNDAGQQTNLTVELRQGSTVIASQAHLNIPGVTGSGWQQGTFTLTSAQAATITDWTNLRLRFRPSTTGSGAKRSAQVSWAEVQFPGPGNPNTLVSYAYDRLYRLTNTTDTSGSRSYTYDPAGNRLTAGSTAFSYDRADRMLTSGAMSVTVDAKGNMTAVGNNAYTFDEANQLRSAAVSGTTETYLYDGDGTRFTRQVGANPAIRYVSDVARDLPQTIYDGTRKYVYGNGLAYAVAGSTVEIYHADRLGSVRNLTNGTGTVTDRYAYGEWGGATHTTGTSAQPFGFTGQPADATGLTYLRARFYDPAAGRFTSRDIWPGNLRACQSLNRYAYVVNDPSTLVDPSGLKSKTLNWNGLSACDQPALGFGIGLISVGVADVAANTAILYAVFAGSLVLSPAALFFAGAFLLSGATSIIAGVDLVNQACGRPRSHFSP
jgi:RHS repeat-associated protein